MGGSDDQQSSGQDMNQSSGNMDQQSGDSSSGGSSSGGGFMNKMEGAGKDAMIDQGTHYMSMRCSLGRCLLTVIVQRSTRSQTRRASRPEQTDSL